MSHATFPIASQKSFVEFFKRAFVSDGVASMDAAKPFPTPTTLTTATVSMTNDTTRMYLMNSGSAQSLTVTKDMTAVPVGDEIVVIALGAGQTTLVAPTGVTIRKLAATLKSNGQYSVMRLLKVDVNTYVLTGDVAAS